MALSPSTPGHPEDVRLLDSHTNPPPTTPHTSQVGHGQGPGPIPRSGSLPYSAPYLASASSSTALVVHALGRGVALAPQGGMRRSLPRVWLNDIAHSGRTIDAAVVPAMSASLDDAQNERLVQLLEVGSNRWDSRDVRPSPQGVMLDYTMPDPAHRVRQLMSMSLLVDGEPPHVPHLQVHLEITMQPFRQEVHALVLTDDDGNTTALPVGRVTFNAPGLPQSALVPMDLWRQEDVQRLLTAPFRSSLAGVAGDDGSLQVSYRTGISARRQVIMHLEPEPVLGGWRVTRVESGMPDHAPWRLQPTCRDWLMRGVHSPQLPPWLANTLQHALTQHAGGQALGPGLSLREPVFTSSQTVSYPHVQYDGLVPVDDSDQSLERWSARAIFAAHLGAWIVAAVRFSHPRLENMDFGVTYRPDTNDWTNPVAPRSNRLDSLPSFGSRRTAEEAELSPRLEPRVAPSLRTDAPRDPDAEPNQDAAQTLVSPGLGAATGTAGAGAAQTPCLTQQQYRLLQGPGHERSAVCPALAVGVALNRYVPFGELLAVNPRAHTGTSVQETSHLLQRHGVVAQYTHFFQAINGGIPTARLGAHLQALLDGRTFDAAVLIYRTPNAQGSQGRETHHHVAVFRAGTQWLMHDGMEQAQPWAVDGRQLAAYTYGARRDDGFGEVEMLAFMRPPQPSQAPASATAPTPQVRDEAIETLMRGRQITVARGNSTSLWNMVKEAFQDTGLNRVIEQNEEGRTSQAQKLNIVMRACSAHEGEIARDLGWTEQSPAVRFDGVEVYGCRVTVCLRIRNVEGDAPATVTGMRVYAPGQAPASIRWGTTVARLPFVLRRGGTINNLQSEARTRDLEIRGIYGRWRAAMPEGGRNMRIMTDIVKTCSTAYSDNSVMNIVDDHCQIACFQVDFHGVGETFYLRFADAQREEVLDVRVPALVRDETRGGYVDEAQDAVLDRMRASMERSNNLTNRRGWQHQTPL